MLHTGFSEEFLKAIISTAFKASQSGPWNITRHYMYTKLSEVFRAFDESGKKCLSISHSHDFAHLLGLSQTSVMEANYPDQSMLSLNYASEAFDFCVSDQVMEHIEGNPFDAFKESVRVVKKGGFVAHTTCFINEVHLMPNDFWRFTPDALRLLSEHCGAKVVECGGWGNKEVWSLINLGFRWANVPDDKTNPIYQLAMNNDDSVPIVTWVVSQKQ